MVGHKHGSRGGAQASSGLAGLQLPSDTNQHEHEHERKHEHERVTGRHVTDGRKYMSDSSDRAAAARAVHQVKTAHRAVDDPVKLARAARIVRAALARRKLTLDELTPLELPVGRSV